MNIVGRSIVLRALDSEDLPALYRWSNDPEIQHNLGGWHFPLSKASLQSWVSSFRHDSLDQRFVIEGPGAAVIGLITLTSINWKDRNAWHGVLIGENEHRGKGYAADAIVTIMRYAFEELGLQRLDTTIVEYNTASLALHIDKCGWIQDGRKESAVFRRNRFWANILVGVDRDRYLAHVAAGKFKEFFPGAV